MIKRILLTCFLCLFATQVLAHVAGVTDTGIRINNSSQLTIVYTAPADSLDELKLLSKAEISQAVLDGFRVQSSGNTCSAVLASTNTLENIVSEQFELKVDCGAPIETLTIEYRLFVDEFPEHENFTRLSILNRSQNFTFSADKREHSIPLAKILQEWQNQKQKLKQAAAQAQAKQETAAPASLWDSAHYFKVGLEHILLGFDHLLFLAALLLLPLGVRQLLLLITSFTLAHSITLGLSVLDMVSLPALWVEIAIAFSIIYVAVENIYALYSQKTELPFISWQRRCGLTFLFGLVHGFGFSYILKEIGLGDQVVGALLFFNLGVEAGQLLVVLLLLPLLYLLFRQKHKRLYLIVGSAVVGLIGCYWVIERLLG